MNGPQYGYVAQPDFLSKEECALLKRTMLKQFQDDEQESFLRICQRTKLDPFTRQIYATRRFTKVKDEHGQTKKVPTLVPVTGIQGLTAVADRTGQYEGCEIYWTAPDGVWKTEWLEDEPPAAAKCIVFKKGHKPEVAIARWMSFVGQSWDYDKKQWIIGEFWDRMPDYMLGKCAKAAALRGAFPDPLSNVFIREELDSNLSDTETLQEDEAKVERNQEREAEMMKNPPPGVKIVESSGTRPTPAEALAPAFPEDKVPETKSKAPAKKAQPPKPTAAPPPPQPTPAAQEEPPDDLDMGEPPPDLQEGAAPAEKPPAEPAWKEHIIESVGHAKFAKRRLGDLNANELAILETQWLPAVREQWDDATEAQRQDAIAFEAAIAASKVAKPW